MALKKKDLTEHPGSYDKARMQEMTLGEVQGDETRHGLPAPRSDILDRSSQDVTASTDFRS
jgi:hypothetical protein